MASPTELSCPSTAILIYPALTLTRNTDMVPFGLQERETQVYLAKLVCLSTLLHRLLETQPVDCRPNKPNGMMKW